MTRFVPVLFLCACGVSEDRIQEMIDASNQDEPGEPGDEPGGTVTADDLDDLRSEIEALRTELQDYADDAAAAAAAAVTFDPTVDAGDLTGTLDPSSLPEIPEDKLPLRDRIVSLPIYGAQAAGGATITQGAFGSSGISLPVGSQFAHSLVVPQDYAPGTPLQLHVVWRTSDASCTFSLAANFLDVARVGRVPFSGNAIGGLTLPPQPMTAPAVAQEGVDTVVEMLDVFGNSLEPLDALNFGFYRPGNDTCSNVSIAGLYVTYQSR